MCTHVRCSGIFSHSPAVKTANLFFHQKFSDIIKSSHISLLFYKMLNNLKLYYRKFYTISRVAENFKFSSFEFIEEPLKNNSICHSEQKKFYFNPFLSFIRTKKLVLYSLILLKAFFIHTTPKSLPSFNFTNCFSLSSLHEYVIASLSLSLFA